MTGGIRVKQAKKRNTSIVKMYELVGYFIGEETTGRVAYDTERSIWLNRFISYELFSLPFLTEIQVLSH